LHQVSFLDRAELVDGLKALISTARSPELSEFRVFELTGPGAYGSPVIPSRFD
jgi:hypothetical protein